MKCAVVTFLVIASTATMLAIAQDGTGHGPPKSPIIGTPLPTPASPATVLSPRPALPKR
jgi:hypothetical protein